VTPTHQGVAQVVEKKKKSPRGRAWQRPVVARGHGRGETGWKKKKRRGGGLCANALGVGIADSWKGTGKTERLGKGTKRRNMTPQKKTRGEKPDPTRLRGPSPGLAKSAELPRMRASTKPRGEILDPGEPDVRNGKAAESEKARQSPGTGGYWERGKKRNNLESRGTYVENVGKGKNLRKESRIAGTSVESAPDSGPRHQSGGKRV